MSDHPAEATATPDPSATPDPTAAADPTVAADPTAAADPAGPPATAPSTGPVRAPGRRLLRRLGTGVVVLVGWVALMVGTGMVALVVEDSGTPSPAAHGTGHDAEWLGHAWVDGRKGPADVTALAAQLRGTGIHDLFVHTGPFNNDGTLDPALLPRARWLTQALHAALPGVRVQAWLGAHPVPGQLRLDSVSTRDALLSSVGRVLDDGFDGVHYDFEPVPDGDPDLVTLLHDTHALTQRRQAILSVSASHGEPLPGVSAALSLLPYQFALWSNGYLHRVAMQVDQVALMAYDTAMWTQSTFGGYVRRSTDLALSAVPPDVALFIGVPAYHDQHLTHQRRAETVAAAVRGIRLALGDHPSRTNFGVAMYVDFAATASDWSSYRNDWSNLAS